MTARACLAIVLALGVLTPSGWAADSAEVTTTVQIAAAPGGPVFAFQESAGQVVMQAEGFDQNLARNSQTWVLETVAAGFSGAGYMTALPNTGVSYNAGFESVSPELVFNVNFSTTGTYYVWIRGHASSGTDDSLHAGLDGTGPASADRLGSFPAAWTWKRDTMDASPATVVVSTPGLHTFHLWMREDGLRVDKLLLRTSSSATAPSGTGPSASPRVLVGPDTTAPALSAIAASNISDTSTVIGWSTDEPATSQVDYGLDTLYGSQSPFNGALVTGHGVTLTGLIPGTLYHYRVLSVDGSGNPAASDDQTFTTAATPPALAYQEAGGQVVMQVETFDANIARNGQSWVRETSMTGASGGAYLRALPNSGVTKNTGYVTGSPEVVFRVNFTNTGTYYVWLRGSAASGTDDSCHAGRDGIGPSTADRISGFTSSWVWKRTTLDASAPATLTISTPGIHTIHLWMREDGLRADKLLLRKSSSATAPSGTGPAASPRL